MLKSLFPWKHNKTKQVMAAQPPMDEELILQEANLLPCHVCGRTFLPNPLKKHEGVCEKNAVKKRKPFDSLKQRVAGTDLAVFHQPTYLKKKEEPVVEKNPRQSKWKEKHLELVTAIRAAKGVPSDTMPSSPPIKPRSTTSLTATTVANERCPSCDRHFGPKAFDRHVEWCKERKARIQQSPVCVQQAKERLEARIKYRVPPLNKSKRSLIREKYSTNSNPHSPEPICPKSTTSTTNLLGSLSRGPSIRKPKSLVNVEKTSEKINRSDVEKGSGDKKRNSTEDDKKMSLSFGLPVIGSPSPKAESVKSLQNKRNPITLKKLNATSINSQVQSMIVCPITQFEVNRRMVTWKDTVKKNNGSDLATLASTGKNTSRSTDNAKVNLGKGALKRSVKQTTLGCVKNDIKEPEIETGQTKNPQKLAKEKTFYLEKPVGSKRRNLPSKRRADFSFTVNKTKSEVLPLQEDVKIATEKILSSNDVCYKKKPTGIPKRSYKKIYDVLKMYKNPPPVKSAGEIPDKSVEGEPEREENISQSHTVEIKSYVAEGSQDYLEKTLDCENCEEKNEEQRLLNKNLQEISKSFRCFEGMSTGTLNLDENLKGVNELSHSFEDDEFDSQDLVKHDEETTDMNKWFEDNFNEEPPIEDQNLETIDDSKSEESVILRKGDEYNEDELDRTSEKDSLEGDPNNPEDSSYFDEVLAPLVTENVDCELDKTNDNFKFSLKSNTSAVDFLPNNLDKSNNIVYLFQSGTNLDLTRDNSQNTLTDKKSWSFFNTTNFEPGSSQISKETLLQDTRSSTFSLGRSFSDINIVNDRSVPNLSEKGEFKKDLIPLFLKRRFVFETESIDFRKTYQDIRSISSVPSMYLSSFKVKNNWNCRQNSRKEEKLAEVQPFIQFNFPYNNTQGKVDWASVGSKERLDILRIAAEKFIQETKRSRSKGPMVNLGDLLEEDYTVPKKKRKIYLSDESETYFEGNSQGCDGWNWSNDSDTEELEKYLERNESDDKNQKVFEFNFDPIQNELKDNSKTLSKGGGSIPTSATDSVMSGMTPRTFRLVEKIVKGRKLKKEHSDVLLAVSVSECEKLLEIDKRCLQMVEKRIDHRADRDRVKLPLIIGSKKVVDQKVKFRFGEAKKLIVKLPRIETKTNSSRESNKRCQQITRDGEKKHLETQSNTSNYDPFEIAQRQFMELLECDDFKPFTPSDSKPSSRPHTTIPTPLKTPTTPLPVKKTVKSADTSKKGKRASVIEPPVNFKDSFDSVTDNDDFELIENMINERFGEEKTDGTNGFYLHNLTQNKDSLKLDKILDNNRKYSDDMSASIDPRLINENDNLSIPEHFKVDDYSPTSTVDTEITLQNDDVDPYSVQYDSKIESMEPKIEKKALIKRSLSLVSRNKREAGAKTSSNSTKKGAISSSNKTVSKPSKSHISSSSVDKSGQNDGKSQKCEKKKGLPLLKRSMTLFDPSPKPSFKNKQEVDDYFNGNELKTMSSSMTTTMISSMDKDVIPSQVKENTVKVEELFAVDDEMYEEYKKYEEMYLREKEQHSNSNKKNKNKTIDLNYGLLTASEEEDHSNNSNNKLSNDSAYGSLRKTSKNRSRAPKLSPLETKHVESTSSSGSENGLSSPAPPTNLQKACKFCHECGTKFPVSTAKFCVECGVKRLVL